MSIADSSSQRVTSVRKYEGFFFRKSTLRGFFFRTHHMWISRPGETLTPNKNVEGTMICAISIKFTFSIMFSNSIMFFAHLVSSLHLVSCSQIVSCRSLAHVHASAVSSFISRCECPSINLMSRDISRGSLFCDRISLLRRACIMCHEKQSYTYIQNA